jgi:hypothetical protein
MTQHIPALAVTTLPAQVIPPSPPVSRPQVRPAGEGGAKERPQGRPGGEGGIKEGAISDVLAAEGEGNS